MPELERKGGFDEIKAILEQNFSKLAKEPRLRLFINPAHIPELKEKLTAIAKKRAF